MSQTGNKQVKQKKNRTYRPNHRLDKVPSHKDFRGGRIYSKHFTPPSVSLQPWYSQVVVISLSGSQWIGTGSIVSSLKKQIYSDAREDWGVFIRYKSVHIWNLTGRSCALSPYDLSGTSVDQLGGFMDAGGPSSFPNIHYKWPLSQTEIVHNNKDQSDSAKNVFNSLLPSGDSGVAHIQVLWRFGSKTVIPTLIDSKIERGLRQVNASQISVLKELQDIKDQVKPSIVKKVIDGAVVGAEVVTALADQDTLNFYERVIQCLDRLEVNDFEVVSQP